MSKLAILLHPKDNTATTTCELAAGDEVQLSAGGQTLRATEPIPIWHKIALCHLPVGSEVYKYGELIGKTTAEVRQGGWVSHENLVSVPRDYASEYVQED